MKKLTAKLAQLAEMPRYLAFVRDACGTGVAAKMAWWTVLTAPSIVRTGTLGAVNERMSAIHPPVRAAGQWTHWERVNFGLFRDILLRRCYWPDAAFVPGAGDVVLDLGANVGAFSVLAAKRMGAGRVFAVEAQEYEHEMLVRNVALNGVADIVMPLLGFAGSGGLFGGGAHSQNTVDLDEVMREHGVREIALLKVNIEGSEFALFERPQAWLRLVRRIAMEVHPPYGDVDALCARLRGLGFSLRLRPSSTPDAAIYLYAERAEMPAAVAA